jgi:ribosome maturation factor RimP
VHEPGPNTLFMEAFERIVHALPHQPEFRNVEVVSHNARPGRFETQLFVMLDREGGLDMATVERVAARINASLDAFTDPYTLEVSSAGLNRPLNKEADYDRFAGRAARIVTNEVVAGAKTHRGILTGLRGSSVILKQGEAEVSLPLASIKFANLEYDVRADLHRAKQEKHEKKAPMHSKPPMHAKPFTKSKNKSKKFRDPSGNGTPGNIARERRPGGPTQSVGGAQPGAERL